MSPHARRLTSLFSAVLLCGAMAISPSAADLLSGDRVEAGVVLAAAKGKRVITEGKRVTIIGGCPYNLDRVCTRNKRGKLVNCRCQS